MIIELIIGKKRKELEVQYGLPPYWCHHHGAKMRLAKFDKNNHLVIISGSAAKVTIRRTKDVDSKVDDGWFVDWEVEQFVPYDEVVRGRRKFDDKELTGAFGLANYPGHFGGWLIDRYGANSAEQGKYIRRGIYLNIPCPGTGNDGDPNVSIHLDDEIRDAIRQLLE